MKECLNCNKEFQAKKETAKYCSTSCRVMWNRKHGKKNQVSPIQIQVLYNSMLELVEKIGESTKLVQEPKPAVQALSFETAPQKVPLKRNPANWVELRRECQNSEDYAKWLEDLENDTFLTSLEKKQIKATV